MLFKVKVSAIYKCSLERAFKTPMLCDVTKIHTGYGFMPKVTHTEDDHDWGKVGSSKKVFVEKSLTQDGGYASMDTVLERKENKYWKIQIDEFQTWIVGFHTFIGEWTVSKIEEQKTLVTYEYSLISDNPILYPLSWIFAKIFWRKYMTRVLNNVKNMAYNEEPYLFE